MKKTCALSLVFVLMFSLFVSSTNFALADEVKARDVLTIGAYDELWVGADLIQSDTFYDIQMMMAEPLFLYNHETGELEGCMCTAPTFSGDGTVMTFEVPEGRKFPSGADLDAGDIKASLEYAKAEGAMKDTFAIIQSISVDGNKVTLNLEYYSTAVLILLVSPFFCVIDSDQLATLTKEQLLWSAQPYGAYYVETYTEGSSVVMKRNPYFQTLNPTIENKGPAYIETIQLNFYEDEFAAISSMQSGEIQYLINITEDGLAQFQAMEGFTVNSTLPPMVRNVQFNTSDPILSDKNVRLAIAYLISRDDIAQVFGGPTCCTPAYSYITKNVMFHNEATDEYFKATYCNNVDKGLALLKEAGWVDTDGDSILDKDGQKLSITFNTATGKNETAALAIQQQLQGYGFEINLQSMTSSLVTEAAKNKEYGMTMCNYWWSEPGRFLVNMYKDHSGFDETEYVAMVKQVESVLDNQKRFELVDQAQRYMMDQLVVLPLYTTSYMKVYKDDLKISFIVDGMFTNDSK